MSKASWGRSVLNSGTKVSKRACCWRLFMPGGRVASLFEREVHALMTGVLLRLAGPDALDRNAQAQPPDRQLGEVEQRVGAEAVRRA
jgi:hypothetical protein